MEDRRSEWDSQAKAYHQSAYDYARQPLSSVLPTFYYHFQDIYDLLDKVLSEVLLVNLNCSIFEKSDLNEESIIRIFTAITNFQKSLSNHCHRGYEDTISRIIREHHVVIFYKMLLKQHNTKEDVALKTTAVILSWGIYGPSVEWRKSSMDKSPEEFIKLSISYILSGITWDSKN